MAFHPDSLPSLKGKVFIVTGGNSGIGYHTVSHLASHGAHVYLCVRSLSKGASALSSLALLHPTLPLNITLLQLDLTSLSSVVSAAKYFLSLETSLHGLVNNAGIMATPFAITNDGYEAQWQTNYLSHWVLTSHLLPQMLRTSIGLPPGSVRIVNVTSSGHLSAPKSGIEFNDLTLKESGVWARYGMSKLANILHIKTLHENYGPGSPSAMNGEGEIWTAAVHPGLVETGLAAEVEGAKEGWLGFESVVKLLGCLGMMYSAEKGASSSLFCVASEEMGTGMCGGYVEVMGRWGEPGWESKRVKDGVLRERLEEWSREMMGKDGYLD